MKKILTLTRKDMQLLVFDKTSLIVTFALPLGLITLIGSVFPAANGISGYDYAFSKVMFWGLIGGAASSIASLAIEKNSGTIIRLQLSPMNKLQMLLGKSVACMTMMFLSSVFSWLVATFVFGLKTNSHFFLILIFLSNAVFLTGVMTFLANFAKTERAAGGISWSVLQVLACFSGVTFPIAMMPPWMSQVSEFNPLTWGVKAMEIVLWSEVTFQNILLPIGIPVVAGIIFFSLSVTIFRWSSHK